jgi:hypothetical protein
MREIEANLTKGMEKVKTLVAALLELREDAKT